MREIPLSCPSARVKGWWWPGAQGAVAQKFWGQWLSGERHGEREGKREREGEGGDLRGRERREREGEGAWEALAEEGTGAMLPS